MEKCLVVYAKDEHDYLTFSHNFWNIQISIQKLRKLHIFASQMRKKYKTAFRRC